MLILPVKSFQKSADLVVARAALRALSNVARAAVRALSMWLEQPDVFADVAKCTVDVNQLAMSVTALMFLREITNEWGKVYRKCSVESRGEQKEVGKISMYSSDEQEKEMGLLCGSPQRFCDPWTSREESWVVNMTFGLGWWARKSVITCINRLVAMLNNPSYVKDALENQGKCSKNIKDKSYANEEFIGVMNMCLKTIYMCFGVLLPLSPKIEHMVSLSQESLKFWQPLVDATFANPILTNRAQPILTFGALISIVNSTQSHSHIKAFNSPTSPFTSPDIKWTSKLDKQLTPALLEMCMTKYHLMKIDLNNFVDWMGMGKETGNVGMHYKREFGSLSSKDKVLKFWKLAPGNPHNLATSSALTSLNSPSLLVHVMMLLYWLLINSSNKNCHNVMLVSMATETKHNFEQIYITCVMHQQLWGGKVEENKKIDKHVTHWQAVRSVGKLCSFNQHWQTADDGEIGARIPVASNEAGFTISLHPDARTLPLN
uniref:Uncharacterized protein n=1 Tax=Timema genevievae TaxID=629358 RepID=A0A7R9JSU5_TIMGE|nr:unnamed protein product [Timema genevievae]